MQSYKVANMLIILMLAKRDFGTLQVQKEVITLIISVLCLTLQTLQTLQVLIFLDEDGNGVSRGKLN